MICAPHITSIITQSNDLRARCAVGGKRYQRGIWHAHRRTFRRLGDNQSLRIKIRQLLCWFEVFILYDRGIVCILSGAIRLSLGGFFGDINHITTIPDVFHGAIDNAIHPNERTIFVRNLKSLAALWLVKPLSLILDSKTVIPQVPTFCKRGLTIEAGGTLIADYLTSTPQTRSFDHQIPNHTLCIKGIAPCFPLYSQPGNDGITKIPSRAIEIKGGIATVCEIPTKD